MVTGRLRQRSWETPRATSARSPRSRLMRSGPPSSGPRPRSSGPASAATTSAPAAGNGPPSAAATSTTRRRLEQPFDAVSAPGCGRGHRLSPTSRLAASSNLAFEAAASGSQILLVDADSSRNRRGPRQHPEIPNAPAM